MDIPSEATCGNCIYRFPCKMADGESIDVCTVNDEFSQVFKTAHAKGTCADWESQDIWRQTWN